MSPISPAALERLRAYAAAHPEIAGVILFGSVARGEAHPESDLDIGVLLTREANTRGMDWLHLVSDMAEIFGREDIDVAILNRATPLLMHRVVRDGHLLYAANNRAVAEFHLHAIQQYEDTRPLREMQYQRLLQQLDTPELKVEADR